MTEILFVLVLLVGLAVACLVGALHSLRVELRKGREEQRQQARVISGFLHRAEQGNAMRSHGVEK